MENEKKLGQDPAFGFGYETKDFRNGYIAIIPHKVDGMSKRFYAACIAMQALLTNYPNYPEIIKESYDLADELLKQENL